MTRALPYTKAGLKRRIDAALESGLYVAGVCSDGTVLTSHTPPDPNRRELDAAIAALAVNTQKVSG
jgi:hypothetical protein